MISLKYLCIIFIRHMQLVLSCTVAEGPISRFFGYDNITESGLFVHIQRSEVAAEKAASRLTG